VNGCCDLVDMNIYEKARGLHFASSLIMNTLSSEGDAFFVVLEGRQLETSFIC
jgi:hypothetical protein